MIDYFRKYTPNFSKNAEPIDQLLKETDGQNNSTKSAISWKDPQQTVLDKLLLQYWLTETITKNSPYMQMHQAQVQKLFFYNINTLSCESSIMVVDHLHLQERNITAPKLSSLTENGLYEFNFVTIYIMHHISTFALLTTQSPTLQPQEILQPQRREG